MRLRFRNNRDFFAGLLFVAIGGGACLVASAYPLGTTALMGPGYFPEMVGGLLVVFGIVLAAKNLGVEGEPVTVGSPRGLVLVTLSVSLFGILLSSLGLVLTTFVSTAVACLASAESRWREFIGIYLFLAVLVTLIFVIGLSMPIALWPEWIKAMFAV